MNKLKLNLILSLLIPIYAFTQTQLNWVRPFPSGNNYYAAPLIGSDGKSNVYHCQAFTNSIDVDPSNQQSIITSIGLQDFYISKLDSNGHFLWVRSLGGSQSETVDGFAVDSIGNSYVLGTFSSSFDADPSPSTSSIITSNGFNDVFVIKLDPNGNLLWCANYGSSQFDGGCTIFTDKYNNAYLYGLFFGVIDADRGPGTFTVGSTNSLNMCLIKLNSSGQLLTAITNAKMSGTGSFATSIKKPICIDNSNNILICGGFTGSFDADPGVGTNVLNSNGNANDLFIQKLDQNMNLLWVKQIGGTSVENVTAIHSDSNGNVILLGSYQNTVDIDPGPGTNILPYATDADFILKLSNSGQYVSGRGFQEGIYVRSNCITDNNLIYLTGYYIGNVGFTDGQSLINFSSKGTSDYYVCALNSYLQQSWVKSFYGKSEDGGENITYTRNKKCIVVGYYNDTICFNNNLTDSCLKPLNQANLDIFMHSFGQNQLIGLIEHAFSTSIKLYPNPSSDKIFIESDEPITSIEVFSCDGKLVQVNSHLNRTNTMIDLDSVSSGIYFLRISNDKNFCYKKIVVTK